jgi:hypothetical protein
VHEVTVNRSSELAIACDYRFQSRHDPVCDASLEPHHYPRVPDARTLSRGWHSRGWLRQPWLARRRPFVMPSTIETWHEELQVPSSRLVPWRTPA